MLGQPLAGIRVVEAGRFAAGPSCATVLADWGADVIKIEPPTGDPARGPGSVDGRRNPRFELHNRSRRSLAVDATVPEGRDLVRELVGNADVFVTNLRPRALHKLGLDHESLCGDNPRLVYALVNGYGIETEAADFASYDHGGFWSYSGLAATFTDKDGVPPQPTGGAGDRLAGAVLAGAVGAALFARERSGQGGLVSTSLLAVGVWMQGSDMSDALATGKSHHRPDRRSPSIPTVNCFRAGDGRWFWLQMMEPERHWTAFLDALDTPVLEEDPRFRSGAVAELIAARGALVEILDEVFRAHPLAEWARRFRERDIPFAPVQTVDDVVRDPVAHRAGAFRAGAHDDLVVASPVRFDGHDGRPVAPSPRPGEHSPAVLAELGLTHETVAALNDRGVVRDGNGGGNGASPMIHAEGGKQP